MFFETGQKNEEYMNWAKALPDMGDDIAGWICDFLKGVGADHVEVLGKFSTHLGREQRYLFAAYKSSRVN